MRAANANLVKPQSVTKKEKRIYSLGHRKDIYRFRDFWGLEKVTKHRRGGNYIRQISQHESFWIYETKVLAPLSINTEFDLNYLISTK